MDNPLVDLVDLNGDGLPDILQTGGPSHQAYLNLGETNGAGSRSIRWSPAVIVEAPPFSEAPSQRLDADTTHLADMDGDGLADLVHKVPADDSIYYFANLGKTNWSERRDMEIPFGFLPPPAPFGEPDVRTADVDFDKRIDLIRADGKSRTYQIWFNHGANEYSDLFPVSQERPVNFAVSGFHLADFNGDRVPDVCRITPGGIEVSAGLGYGQFLSVSNVVIPDENIDDLIAKAKLADITGDGLSDLVIDRAPDGQLWYWINLGNYSLSSRKKVINVPRGSGINPAIRLADLNGNGSTDLIYADQTSDPKLVAVDLGEIFNCGGIPNALTAISNGIGRVTLIGYAPSTKFAAEDAAAGHAWTNLMPNTTATLSEAGLRDQDGGGVWVVPVRFGSLAVKGAAKNLPVTLLATRSKSAEFERKLRRSAGCESRAVRCGGLRPVGRFRNGGDFSGRFRRPNSRRGLEGFPVGQLFQASLAMSPVGCVVTSLIVFHHRQDVGHILAGVRQAPLQ
jgi:hypothetical protein